VRTNSGALDVAPRWLRRLGVSSWLLIGVAGALAIAGLAYNATVGITVPLIIAVVIGVAVAPLVDIMERRRVRRSVGALITMLLLALILTAALVVVVRGLISQGPQVWAQLTAGVQALGDWLAGFGVTEQQLAAIQSTVRTALPKAAEGLTSFIGSGLSSVVAFLFGTFLSVFMLFYILSDMPLLSRWVGAHVGLRPDLGLEIVNDGARSIRNYFKGSTVVAFVNTVAIVIGLVIFNVPLIGPIAIVTFILAYIPYIGAIISGAFAVLIALGSGGTTAAIGVLVFVLVSQNLLQQPVSAWAVGSALDLHPLVVLISTVLGGIVMGVIGATLAAPLTAMAVQATVRLRKEREAIASAGLSGGQPAEAAAGDRAR
jgi:predicted PurR-regulated permease PerM